MIDLNKQNSQPAPPSEEEIQDFVNQVYNYAINLIVDNGYSYRQAKEELIHQGLNEPDAESVISNIKLQINEAKKSASNKEIGYGLLWAVGGVVVTAITGGSYIFYGAVIWGVWLFLKGLYHKLS